jgi:molybdate transport repressor ModE-like protein
MSRIELRPAWVVRGAEEGARSLDAVVDLLTLVEEENNLSRACRKLDMSYRHAWGLVQAASRTLGGPLLNSVRGQGARLTPLGQRLVWANKRLGARLAPMLANLASELEAELRQVNPASGAPVRIHGSHSFAMDLLRDHLREQGIASELRYSGSEDALASLSHRTCELAGFHTPVGELETPILERLGKWLDPREYVLIHLVRRRQGIVVAAGNPKRIVGLADLARSGVRFVNRPRGSGTRLLLDLLLQHAGIDCRRIAGFDNPEYTHAAVAACIASGIADAGIAVETAAYLYDLTFVPLLEERYVLACHRDALATPSIEAVLQVLRSREFHTRLSLLPGLAGRACGETIAMVDAYPQLRGAGARNPGRGRRAAAFARDT